MTLPNPPNSTQAPSTHPQQPLGPSLGEDTRFTVSAPAQLLPGMRFSVRLWLHRDGDDLAGRISQRGAALGEVRGFALPLSARLNVPALEIRSVSGPLVWQNGTGYCALSATVPQDATPGNYTEWVRAYAGDFEIARVLFTVQVGRVASRPADVTQITRPYRAAFVCWADADRAAVQARLHPLGVVLPHLRLTTNSGDLRFAKDWRGELRRALGSCDVMYLMWSAEARDSATVGIERHSAVETHGAEYVVPVPLGAQPVPLNQELW